MVSGPYGLRPDGNFRRVTNSGIDPVAGSFFK
jgi:hypothetical protein